MVIELKTTDANRVRSIFGSCLFEEGEDSRDRVRVIASGVWFNRRRLEQHHQEILVMQENLPDTLRKVIGGRYHVFWTVDPEDSSLPDTLDVYNQIALLGLAIIFAKLSTPEEAWGATPAKAST